MLSALARRPVRIAAPASRAAPSVNFQTLLDRMLGRIDPDAPSPEAMRKADVGLVWRLIDIRANFVARAFLDPLVQMRRGAQAEETSVGPAHPWVRLLSRPHPTTPPLIFWTWVQKAKDLGSGAALVVERDAAGSPLYLHPVYPEFGAMRPVGASDGTIDHFVFQPEGAAATRPYAREDVIWIHHPHPVTPYETASMVEVAASAMDARRYAEMYQATQARSGGFPAAYASGDFGSEPNAKSFSDRFEAQYLPDPETGRVARRFPVLPSDVKILPLSIAPVDMRAIETMGLTAGDLAYIFLGTRAMGSENATYSNSTQATRDFVQFVGQPEADKNAAQITAGLEDVYRTPLAQRGTVRVIVPDLMPLDPEERRKDRSHRLSSGLVSIDEVRAEDGQAPWGGDAGRPMVSGLLQPLRIGTDPEPAPRPAPTPPPASDGEDPDDDADAPEPDEPRAGHVDTRGTEPDDDPLAVEWRMVDGRKRKAEKPVEAVSLAFVRRLAADVAGKIRGSRAAAGRADGPGVTGLLSLVFNLSEWADEWEGEIGPALANAMRAGFETGALRVSADLTFDATSAAVRESLAASVGRASSVPETLRGEVERALAAGLEVGEDMDALAARVESALGDVAPWKARQIAQTSGTEAFAAGQVQSFREAGVKKKRWLSQRDGNVRPSHSALDGEEVGIDEAFSNGSQYPNEINCRCDVLPIVEAADDDDRLSPRDAYIRAEYPGLRDRHGREVALTTLRDRIAARVESDGWAPIGERQIWRIARPGRR